MKNSDVSRYSSSPLGRASEVAVRGYVERTRAAAPTEEHWRRLSARLDPPRNPHFAQLVGCAGVGALAALALGWFISHDHGGSLLLRPPPPIAAAHRADRAPGANVQAATSLARGPAATFPRAGAVASADTSEPALAPLLVIDDAPVRLRAGASRVTPAVTLAVGQGAAAWAVMRRGHPVVTVDAGRIQVRSNESDVSKRVEVRAGAYGFFEVGTVFEVSVESRTIELLVREGAVRVVRGAEPVATVGPGQSWRTPVEVAVPTSGSASTPDLSPGIGDDPRSCRKLVGLGELLLARDCYARVSSGTGLPAETALYELGNLRRNGGDAAGALESYRSYLARFPAGALGTEVELSMIELLPGLGQPAEALRRSAELLAGNRALERSAELHLLRGNIYCEALGDLERAAVEYDMARSKKGSPAADEACLRRGVCAEALGDFALARRMYGDYLQRGNLPHMQEAKKRLADLGD